LEKNCDLNLVMNRLPLFLLRWFAGILVFTIIYQQPVGAQQVSEIPVLDSTLIQRHSPRTATIYSTVLPGLGQAYNKKYWKIPVIYVGFGACAYFWIFNTNEYRFYKNAYNNKLNNIPTQGVPEYATAAQLQAGRDYYRRNLEVTAFAALGVYVLNILDATVDAYFFEYDISEDLSLRVTPGIIPSDITALGGAPGLRMSFKF